MTLVSVPGFCYTGLGIKASDLCAQINIEIDEPR